MDPGAIARVGVILQELALPLNFSCQMGPRMPIVNITMYDFRVRFQLLGPWMCEISQCSHNNANKLYFAVRDGCGGGFDRVVDERQWAKLQRWVDEALAVREHCVRESTNLPYSLTQLVCTFTCPNKRPMRDGHISTAAPPCLERHCSSCFKSSFLCYLRRFY